MSATSGASALCRCGGIDSFSPPGSKKIAIAVVLGAMALVVIDAAIANFALSTLANDLHVSPAASILVVTSYQLALIIALLPCAALGESVGYRLVFIGGVTVFTLGAVCCAYAPNLHWLVAARFLQGIGASAVMALYVALFRFIVPHEKLGAVIGWNALVVALSSAAGPTLGAAILAVGTWHCLFAFEIPIGVVILFGALALPKPEGNAVPLDLVSVLLSAGALAALVIAAYLVAMKPAIAAPLLLASGFCFASLIRRESPKATPLIPIDLLRGRPFRLSLIASILCFAGQTIGLISVPFYLQHVLKQDALTTGLYMTAWPLTVAIAAPLVGPLFSHIKAHRLCAFGSIFLTIGLGAAALWPLHNSATPLIIFMMLCGLGFGLFNVFNNRALHLSTPRKRSGAAGGMQGSARLLGQIAGGIVMALLFTSATADVATRVGFAIGAALTLVAGIISILQIIELNVLPGTNDLRVCKWTRYTIEERRVVPSSPAPKTD